MGESWASDINLGLLLGSIIGVGIKGFRRESITLQVTNNKSIILRGWKKFIYSFTVLSIGLFLFLGFVVVVLATFSGKN